MVDIRCKYEKLMPVNELKPHPKNPNKHPQDQINRLAEVIEYQGVRHPIIISRLSGYIVVGHGRLEAFKKLGLKEVPVDYQEFESEAQEYAFIVSDNAIAEWAELDLPSINGEMGEFPDLDVSLLGLKDFVIQDYESLEPGAEDDDVPAEQEDPNVALGDLYRLGEHRLLCGDATNPDNVGSLMAGQRADMCFTDPPYGVSYDGGHFHSGDVNIKRPREKLASDDDTQIYKDVVPVISEHTDGPCYTWYADTKPSDLYNTVEAVGQIHALLIWHKTNATYAAMNAQYKQRHEPLLYWKPKGSTLRWCGPSNERTIWEMKKDGRNEYHPTQKPVELAERAINNHKAETVLDLFGGSGSTLIACEKTKRKCYMMELEPKYVRVIIDRWEKYTGKKAELING